MNKEEKTQDNISFIILNVILVILVFVLFLMIYKFRVSNVSQSIEDNNILVQRKIVIDQSKIQAKAVYILDLKTGKTIYSKNPDYVLPLASLTKLMTSYVARDILPKESLVVINKEDLSEEGDNGLLLNEKWKLLDLIDYSLLVSSNDASCSIAFAAGAFKIKTLDKNKARSYFISKMNEKAKDLSLDTLKFSNETGLDKGSVLGGQGSARDVALLLKNILTDYPDLLESTSEKKITLKSLDSSHVATNTNVVVNKIPNVLASKTGFTSLAGGNLSVVFDVGIGRPIAIVVLGSTEEGRFEDMLYLASSTIKFITE